MSYCQQFANVLYDMKFDEKMLNRLKEYLNSVLLKSDTSIEKKKQCKRALKGLDNFLYKDNTYDYVFEYALAVALGVERVTVSRWIDEKTQPFIDILPQISEIFNVSADYLLGIEEVPEEKEDDNILEQYGLDIKKFKKMYDRECGNQEEYHYVLDALQLLLTQAKTPFQLLNTIGQYLTLEIIFTKTFLSKDIDELKKDLSQLEDADEIKKLTNKLLNSGIPTSHSEVHRTMLDKLIQEITKYRNLLSSNHILNKA